MGECAALHVARSTTMPFQNEFDGAKQPANRAAAAAILPTSAGGSMVAIPA